MSRKSLYYKLSLRSDFPIIKKRIVSQDKPLVYIRDTYKCSPLTAKRLLEDLTVDGSGKKSLKNSNWISLFLDEVGKKSKELRTFLEVFEKVDKMSLDRLVELFTSLNNSDCTTRSRECLVLAVKYLIQNKYYYKGNVSDTIKAKEEVFIRDCIK